MATILANIPTLASDQPVSTSSIADSPDDGGSGGGRQPRPPRNTDIHGRRYSEQVRFIIAYLLSIGFTADQVVEIMQQYYGVTISVGMVNRQRRTWRDKPFKM